MKGNSKMKKCLVLIGSVCMLVFVAYAAKGPVQTWTQALGPCKREGWCVKENGCWVNGNCQYRLCEGDACLGLTGNCNETVVVSDPLQGNCGGCGYTWVCVPPTL